MAYLLNNKAVTFVKLSKQNIVICSPIVQINLPPTQLCFNWVFEYLLMVIGIKGFIFGLMICCSFMAYQSTGVDTKTLLRHFSQ
jgi:hypothetical protein